MKKLTRRHNSKKKGPRWIALSDGLVKMNVDAATSRTATKCATGVVCRDRRGKFIAASARVWQGTNAPEVLEALVMAEDCNLQEVCVASDCSNVMPTCAYMMVLRDIKERGLKIGVCSLCTKVGNLILKHII